MIKKFICYLFGHDLTVTPCKTIIDEGFSKILIPSYETCFRCKKLIDRPLKDYEIPFFIKGMAIYDSNLKHKEIEE